MNSWPADLPQRILYSGASEKMGDVRMKAQTESGPGKSRPRYTLAVDELACSMILTYAQKEKLKEFVRTTSKQGTLPFTFPKPQVTGVSLTVLFNALPTFTPQRPGMSNGVSVPLWKASFSLDVMP